MWEKIVEEFSKNPRDLQTQPTTNVTPLWFYVQVIDGDLYVGKAKSHEKSCSIQGLRRINPSELEKILDIYHRRNAGEKVSREATATTKNQVYWYGIFAEMKM